MVRGHHVGVQVGHALAHPVVHGDERPLRRHPRFDGAGRQPSRRQEGREQVVGQVGQHLDVPPRDDQAVPGEQRAVVEEGHGVRVLATTWAGRSAHHRDRTGTPSRRAGLRRARAVALVPLRPHCRDRGCPRGSAEEP